MKRRRSNVDNLVANNPEYDRRTKDPQEVKQDKKANSDTLYDDLSPIQRKIIEIYGGRYGYRQTSSGRWRERDEPTIDIEDKQNDAIRKSLQKQKAADARNRLKSQNKVPTRKDGRKVFEEFYREASQRSCHDKIKSLIMRDIYGAAQHSSFDDWSLWLKDQYGLDSK